MFLEKTQAIISEHTSARFYSEASATSKLAIAPIAWSNSSQVSNVNVIILDFSSHRFYQLS